MTTFQQFTQTSAIDEATIARFSGQVPSEVVAMWRENGAGHIGADGFFRVVDPGRAAQMLEGVVGFPPAATVLFSTGFGDIIFYANNTYFVIKFRWGAIDITKDMDFASLVELIANPVHREPVFQWLPYPDAATVSGVPGTEQCYGFVPLLALGGPNDAAHLQLVGMYEHISLIVQTAGMPKLRGLLPAPTAPASDVQPRDQLIGVGRALFAKLVDNAQLNVIDLPDALGVCLVHTMRGGGKIYVATDKSVLFVGSAVDFDAGLTAFRNGARTDPEKFNLNK